MSCPVNHGNNMPAGHPPMSDANAPKTCPVMSDRSMQKFADDAKFHQQHAAAATSPSSNPYEGMDISMCPVHGGKAGKSNEMFMKYAQTDQQQQQQVSEQQKAIDHIHSNNFLAGAPRFEPAKPNESSGTDLVGDIFPDSKPLFGQRIGLSSTPAKSTIPKSDRSKPLQPPQLPSDAPQVPDHLKQAAQALPVCTSDSMGPVSPEAMLPGKDYKEDTWTFPSHQRFYNAMKKKGWNPNEMDIPYIVSIHNTVNQQVWSRIMQYEKYHIKQCADPKLLKFQGRPQDLSPKAQVLTTFGYAHPYDRHDWTVDRCGTDVRYIIDFYDGPQRPDVPVSTHLDVRPALDTPSAAIDRLRRYGEEFFEM